jgi:hypothetical protein
MKSVEWRDEVLGELEQIKDVDRAEKMVSK